MSDVSSPSPPKKSLPTESISKEYKRLVNGLRKKMNASERQVILLRLLEINEGILAKQGAVGGMKIPRPPPLNMPPIICPKTRCSVRRFTNINGDIHDDHYDDPNYIPADISRRIADIQSMHQNIIRRIP
jgi:hypothetical protein